MKKILGLCVFIIFCLSLFIGLYNISSFESLMRPPKLSGESSLLQQAFEQSVSNSDGVVMKNPLSGEYTSSYLFYDIDNNGVTEALVFYSDLLEDNTICVNVFKKINNDWNFVSKIKGKSDEVYEVNFADINGDNICELLLSWNTPESIDSVNSSGFLVGNRSLSIYNYGSDAFSLLKTETYSSFYINDFNSDNADDLFILNINLSDIEKKTSGRVLSFNSDYSVAQDKNFSMTGMLEVYNIVSDVIQENGEVHSRLFIDGAFSEMGVVTEVVDISHKNFDITLPLYDNNHSSQPSTLRRTRILSRDFDDDGFIEIPTLQVLPYGEILYKDTNEKSDFNLTVWNELDNNAIKVDEISFYNSSMKYILLIPKEWLNNITAEYDHNTSNITFFDIGSNGEIEDELFSVKCFTRSEWKEDNLDYKIITENNSYIYSMKVLTDSKQVDYTEYINENFIVIE